MPGAVLWNCALFVAIFLQAVPSVAWGLGPRYSLYGKARLVEIEAPNVVKMEMLDGKRTTPVRLLGVGSPHNRDRTRRIGSEVVLFIQKHQLWEASRTYVRSLLQGKVVEVWTRKWDRYDDKNRLLAYIMVPADGERPLDLNAEIIRNGMGFVTRDYVHVTFASYRQLEEDARKHQRGLWKGILWKQASLTRSR
ncbi:MAG TPA: thermonuclease family protein [Desulfomonilaceae bacterium]|nr:thermonuclease family protein [Desulfomonilaceae bacterium]